MQDGMKNWRFSTSVSQGSGPLPRAKFNVYRGKNVGIQPSKLSKIVILPTNLPLMGDAFA